ncbi:MAG: hypothetical protein LKH90_07690, partial [Levilactobacillus sp.]|nr:hypothetical protein [Levilactobacillus sp.]
VKQTMQKVHQQFQDSQSPDYYVFIQKRYLDLFDSFIYFLGHPQIPTFLGLQSILPKREEDYQSLQMNGQFIENVWRGLSQVLCSAETIQPRLCMIAKKLSPNQDTIETQVAAALKLPAEEATRVYLLSAYATLGVGQNLHYLIGELERGRTLAIAPKSARASDQRFKMVDIGGVYLGQVTNIFTQIPAVATQQNRLQWIKGFYELLGLVDNSEISLAEVDRYARFQGQGIPVRQFRQTLSYVGAHTRIILQAVGRLDRAFNKLPETTVMLGTEVADYFNVTMLADYQLGPVAQAIRDYQRQKKYIILTPDKVQGIHWQERTCETQRAVNEMVKYLQKEEEAGWRYRRYRETLIKYPTMTTRQYNMWQTKPEFAYLQRNDTAYRVQREGEVFGFKQDHSGNMEVSAERADLPIIGRNPSLCRLFNENQWPLSWQAADYVMNPAQFDSYLGILGEKCGQYLIEKFWSVRLQPLTLPNYELFDFQTKEHVLIDFKHWRQPHRRDVGDERRHVKSKLTEIQQRDPNKNWRVLIVNLLEPAGTRQFHSQKLKDDRIMEVPFLLNRKGEFAVTMADQREIGDFLNG